MFGWFKNKVLELSIDVMKEDLIKFNAMLKGVSDTAMGGLLVGSSAVRYQLIRTEKVSKDIFLKGPVEDTLSFNTTSMLLSNIIKAYQKRGDTSYASFCMVMMHTFRSLSALELVPLGKEMWKELERGFPYIKEGQQSFNYVADSMNLNTTGSNIHRYYFYVPIGLESQNILKVYEKVDKKFIFITKLIELFQLSKEEEIDVFLSSNQFSKFSDYDDGLKCYGHEKNEFDFININLKKVSMNIMLSKEFEQFRYYWLDDLQDENLAHSLDPIWEYNKKSIYSRLLVNKLQDHFNLLKG